MEEMNIIVEEALLDNLSGVAKDSVKDTVLAYGMASVFVVGCATVVYGGYKGVKKLMSMKSQKETKVILEECETVNDVESDI